MKKIESFEIEPSAETWAMRREGRGLVAPERRNSCRCGRCRLYRWYPPLLVASTIMTAVFCFLYLTKPVFLEAPMMKVNDGGRKVPPGYMIAGTKGANAGDPGRDSAAGIAKELDPGQLSFPDGARQADPVIAALSKPEPIDLLDVPALEGGPKEEELAVAPVAEVPAVGTAAFEAPKPMPVRVSVGKKRETVEPALPGGFQPLRVEKADRPLFQSLTKADLARLEARRRADEAPELAPEEGQPDAGTAEDGDEASAVAEAMDKAPEEADDTAAEFDPVVAALAAEGFGDAAGGEVGGPKDRHEPENEVGGDEPVMKASFIGEFYLDEEEKRADEMLNKTVMR